MINESGQLISECMRFPSEMKVLFLDVEEKEYYTIIGVGQFVDKLNTVVVCGKKEVDENE